MCILPLPMASKFGFTCREVLLELHVSLQNLLHSYGKEQSTPNCFRLEYTRHECLFQICLLQGGLVQDWPHQAELFQVWLPYIGRLADVFNR